MLFWNWIYGFKKGAQKLSAVPFYHKLKMFYAAFPLGDCIFPEKTVFYKTDEETMTI